MDISYSWYMCTYRVYIENLAPGITRIPGNILTVPGNPLLCEEVPCEAVRCMHTANYWCWSELLYPTRPCLDHDLLWAAACCPSRLMTASFLMRITTTSISYDTYCTSYLVYLVQYTRYAVLLHCSFCHLPQSHPSSFFFAYGPRNINVFMSSHPWTDAVSQDHYWY